MRGFAILLGVLRFVGFFIAVLLLTPVLAGLPVVGAVFRIPFLGFWFTAILLSALFAKIGTEAVDAGRRKSLERSFGSVDTPHHKGKLGALYLTQGRARKAIPLLEEAAAGDPETVEWRYRLAQAMARVRGLEEEGICAIDSVLEEDEEHAFGASMLLSAELYLNAGRPEDALARAERFEHNHGASPESALLRGRALKSLGRSDEAAAAFDQVGDLAASLPSYSGSRSWTWRMRALWAKLVG